MNRSGLRNWSQILQIKRIYTDFLLSIKNKSAVKISDISRRYTDSKQTTIILMQILDLFAETIKLFSLIQNLRISVS